MSDANNFATLTICPKSGSMALVLNGRVVETVPAQMEIRIPASFSRMDAVAGHSRLNTLPVGWLSPEEKLPEAAIGNIFQGSLESFATHAGLRYVRSNQDILTAIWAKISTEGVQQVHILTGGPKKVVHVPLANFLGLLSRESGPEDSTLELSLDPESIEFLPNETVSKLMPLSQMFPTFSFTNGAIVRFEGKQLLTRYRVRLGPDAEGGCAPLLQLEAVWVNEGDWDGVDNTRKLALNSSASTAILLHTENIKMFSYLPDFKLSTPPAFLGDSLTTPPPTEALLRFVAAITANTSTLGRAASTREEWDAYWVDPKPFSLVSSTPVWFPPLFLRDIPVSQGSGPDVGDTSRIASNLIGQMEQDEFQANMFNVQLLNADTMHPAVRQHRGNSVPSTTQHPSVRPPTIVPSPMVPNTSVTNPIGSSTAHPLNPPHQVSGGINHDPLNAPKDYTQKCQVPGCHFTSSRVLDISNIYVAFEEMNRHKSISHPELVQVSGSGHTSKPDKSVSEWKEATNTRMISKTSDNAINNLSDGRFFSCPLDLKYLGMAMPVEQKPVHAALPLLDCGVDVVNKDIVRKLYNRTCTDVKLKHFTSQNLKLSKTSDDQPTQVQVKRNSFKLSMDYKEITRTVDGLKALNNYVVIYRLIHPWDLSPQSMYMIARDSYFDDENLPHAALSSFFDKFINEAAARAERRGPPLVFQEVFNLWNTYVVPRFSDQSMKRHVEGCAPFRRLCPGRQGQSGQEQLLYLSKSSPAWQEAEEPVQDPLL